MARNIDKNIFMKPVQATSTVESTIVSTPVIEAVNENVFEIKNLSHVFDKGTDTEYHIFDNFNLAIKDEIGKGEIVSIMGGSGCGKSCILKMAAGLMKPQDGEILIHGKNISEYGSVPMVFQAYSNYEWLTVLDNVALPMILKGIPKKEAQDKAMELLKVVGLDSHANKYAKSTVMSGGQLQRISIARCLASGSNVFFLDEATGALDIKMKREIQDIILKVYYDSGVQPTIINVTHSIEEALYLSNKIIILKPNPCTIFKEMNINYNETINGKRGAWVFDSPEYLSYHKELSGYLEQVCK